ncbi:MAG: proton-conducting transporter membrane subunit [Candidatus Omnitrophica bacterium]|nr:proton-conducting transporter membrane subunit [Candidatus Omnitrophota bacterium]
MKPSILLLPILIPAIFGALMFILPRKARHTVAFLVAGINLALAIALFRNNLVYSFPWFAGKIEFALRLYQFSGFIMLSAAFFAFLIVIYSLNFMKGKNLQNQFYAYILLCIAMANGAVLADNLLLLLFFWEGLLLILFGFIAIGRPGAFKTATKAFIIVGISDLCMMIGVALTWMQAGTLTISKINLALTPMAGFAFIMLMIGAISKAGSMPFHSWIPDAADDAPLPFMALLPASLEKLLGIYFLTRISLDMFKLAIGSWISVLLMAIGAITIILAVMMALVQKDYKRLLSYHAISQVGYMILGIGTCIPVGIVGGLFHMINNALYKSCLFLTGGAVEKQAGTTDLHSLGGLRFKMPITCACFLITAASISGMPPFNGFFSKELIYDAALSRGMIFYLAAVVGTFFTAASFLKLGHAAFFGKERNELKHVKEAPLALLVPMIVIALTCVVFGIFNYLPLNYLIQPVLGARLEGHSYGGFHINVILTLITILVLAGAFIHHIFMAKLKGEGLKAADDIRYAPVLSQTYDLALKRFFDPYEIGLKGMNIFSRILWGADKGIDWVYNSFVPGVSYGVSKGIRRMHTGYYPVYISWALVGMFAVLYFLRK